MAEDQQPPVIAIVGAPQVGKKALLSRILGRPCSEASSPPIWNIDTYYYTAEVRCKVLLPSEAGRPQDYEAVILVFDADQEDSFVQCKRWASQAETAGEGPCLCVANKCDRLVGRPPETTESRQAWVSGCRDWCLTQSFEYVEVSAENLEVDESLADRDGDCQGVSRVISALQAHLWPGMQMRSGQSRGTGGLEGLVSSSARTHPADTSTQALREGAPAQANGIMANGGGANGPDSATSSSSSGFAATGLREPQGDIPQSQQPADSEEEFEAYEQILAQASQARESLSGMPDDQRRAEAARLALRFVQMLGLEEEEESDDPPDVHGPP